MFDEEELLRRRLLDEDASSPDCRPTPFMATHHDDDDDGDDHDHDHDEGEDDDHDHDILFPGGD